MDKLVFATYNHKTDKNDIHIVDSEEDFEALYKHFDELFDNRAHFDFVVEDFQDLVDYVRLYDVSLTNVIKVGKRQ